MKFDTLYKRLMTEEVVGGEHAFITEVLVSRISKQIIQFVYHVKTNIDRKEWPTWLQQPHGYDHELTAMVEMTYDKAIEDPHVISAFVKIGYGPKEAMAFKYQIVPRVLDVITQSGVLAPSEGGNYSFVGPDDE